MLLALIAGWLVMSTDLGRATVKAVRVRRKATQKARRVAAKKAKGRGSSVRLPPGIDKAYAATRKTAKARKPSPLVAALGRAGRAAFAAAGTAAQSRGASREPPARPVRRAVHDPPAEPLTAPPTSDIPTEEPQTTEAPAESTAQEDTMAGTEYERPSSDGQLLEMIHSMTEAIRAEAAALQEAAAMLGQMGLASSVHGQFNTAAEHLLEAASAVHRAGVEFEAHYEEARTIAKRGMRFEGTEAA